MSYKIVKQNRSGQVIGTVSNGWRTEESAQDRARELDEEMILSNACEMRGFSQQCFHVVVLA